MDIEYSIMSNNKVRDNNGNLGFKQEFYETLTESEIEVILLKKYKEDFSDTEESKEYKCNIEKIIL